MRNACLKIIKGHINIRNILVDLSNTVILGKKSFTFLMWKMLVKNETGTCEIQ